MSIYLIIIYFFLKFFKKYILMHAEYVFLKQKQNNFWGIKEGQLKVSQYTTNGIKLISLNTNSKAIKKTQKEQQAKRRTLNTLDKPK